MAQSNLHPSPSQVTLKAAFVGKSLHDSSIPLPSAILDISKLRQNCKQMLDAISELNLAFRAHVKTHKTNELTRLQVGSDCKDVRLIVSTVIEAESLVPLLEEFQSKGAKVNVLYGVPLGPSKVARLAALGRKLGAGSVAALVDNPGQLEGVRRFKRESGAPMRVFIKADSGYSRAGLFPKSDPMIELVKLVGQAETEGDLEFLGFYSHNSLSYGGNSPDDAMDMLKLEIDTCRQAAEHIDIGARQSPLVISVGASPSALSIQNILSASSMAESGTSAAQQLQQILDLTTSKFVLEIHAGVYPVFDLQQVAASSRVFPSSLAAHQSQALTILAEVVSAYPARTEPEALISAGTLALAREPCKSYPGWGVLSSWGLERRYSEKDSVDPARRIIVKRISQEHGVVGREGDTSGEALPLEVGERVRVWINHACIASTGFGWYLVVDSEKDDDVIEDVWVRCSGW